MCRTCDLRVFPLDEGGDHKELCSGCKTWVHLAKLNHKELTDLEDSLVGLLKYCAIKDMDIYMKELMSVSTLKLLLK